MKLVQAAFLLATTLQAADVAQLSWLTGCWSLQQGAQTTEEHWTTPVGGQMSGISRISQSGKVVFNEFMRIDTEKDGIYYSPRIGTPGAGVRFKLTKQTDTEVIFENPTHDFPQRILYSKSATGLAARIDGTEKGKSRAEDYPMKAVPCK